VLRNALLPGTFFADAHPLASVHIQNRWRLIDNPVSEEGGYEEVNYAPVNGSFTVVPA
jgi:hypothetical protein